MTQPRRIQVIDYFDKHIKFTYPKQKVRRKEFLLYKGQTHILSRKIYISSWSIKHIYDKRPEFCEFLVLHLYSVCNYPEGVYLNKNQRDGEFLLVKKYKEYQICLVLRDASKGLYIVTAFGIKERYLRGLKKIH